MLNRVCVCLCCRSEEHPHSHREEPAGVRLVGGGSPSQLPGRPPHGPGLVPALRSVPARHMLLLPPAVLISLSLSPSSAGFQHLLPWYYMIYFLILLVHRDSRDMSECRRKYGSAWEEYCRTVRYRLIPRVY